MEDHAVVVALASQLDEVGGRLGGTLGVDLDLDDAFVGLDRRPGHLCLLAGWAGSASNERAMDGRSAVEGTESLPRTPRSPSDVGQGMVTVVLVITAGCTAMSGEMLSAAGSPPT